MFDVDWGSDGKWKNRVDPEIDSSKEIGRQKEAQQKSSRRKY